MLPQIFYREFRYFDRTQRFNHCKLKLSSLTVVEDQQLGLFHKMNQSFPTSPRVMHNLRKEILRQRSREYNSAKNPAKNNPYRPPTIWLGMHKYVREKNMSANISSKCMEGENRDPLL